MQRRLKRPVSAFQSMEIASRLENLIFRLCLTSQAKDIFGRECDEAGEDKKIVDHFHYVAACLNDHFMADPSSWAHSRTGPYDEIRKRVRDSLPLIFRGEKSYLWPNWRALDLLLFYNSRESFSQNSNLMYIVSFFF
jgi:hypothetical protein